MQQPRPQYSLVHTSSGLMNPVNGHLPFPASDSSESVTSVSIQNWIQKLHTPPATSYTSFPRDERPAPLDNISIPLSNTPTRHSKRRRDSDSLPSVFLGEGPSFRKRRKVLQETAYNMQPFTPPADRSSTKHSDGSQTSSNITPSKPARELKALKTPYAIGQIMASHGLVHNDAAFSLKYPMFRKDVMTIVDGERLSAMRQQSAEKIGRRVAYYERLSEATFMHNVIPVLLGGGYTLDKITENFSDQDKKAFAWQGKQFRDLMDDEWISTAINCDFRKTLLPNKYTELEPEYEAEITKALAKTPGMTTPRPDYVFGLRTDKKDFEMNQHFVPQEARNLLEICAGMFHIFFIIEGKGAAGSAAEAENQARRGGATLVHASRQLQAMVGDLPDVPGVDEKHFVFSATLSPQILTFWVHWYEGPTSSQRFHMNRVRSFDIHDMEVYPRIRQTLHNILSWGANQRVQLQQHKDLHTLINTYARRVLAQKQQDKLDIEVKKAAEQAQKEAKKASPRKRLKPDDD